ncbi:MAG: hypothetical protein BMS9Abin26_1934 [Gammaproteobacteria bacterium]|nr:MAG: hypothetical protein BMS9Abin26_1934 [Gammaproteobacteria bacterium]
MTGKYRILVVDDEPLNLEIIEEHLDDEGYAVVTAENGVAAWELLEKDPEFDTILLDRMMPEMDGIEVLKKIKASHTLRDIPVIMQTAASSQDQIAEGIHAGAYYYLTKPFNPTVLCNIVKAALLQITKQKELRDEAEQTKSTMRLMDSGYFTFKTLKDARSLASLISGAFPDPDKVVLGLSELMINAIEHGNLGLNYKDKSGFIESGNWEKAINELQQSREHRYKYAEVIIKTIDGKLQVRITDMGNGFDWEPFMEIDTDRAHDTHGRGIAIARLMSFDEVKYLESGNQVVAITNKYKAQDP